jgi:hypothetical protein
MRLVADILADGPALSALQARLPGLGDLPKWLILLKERV